MLSPKPWKTESLLRLIFSVFFSVLIGAVILAGLQYHPLKAEAARQFYLALAGAVGCLSVSLALLVRPWHLEGFFLRLTALVVVFCVGFSLAAFVQKQAGMPAVSPRHMLVGVLSFQGAALIWVALFVREHKISWREAFGFSQRWPRAILLGVIAACLFMPVGRGLQLVSTRTIEWTEKRVPRLGLKPETQQAVQSMETAVTWRSRLALGFVTILLVPLAEELLFRGILYPWIKQAGFPRLAWWGTAFLFAAMHANLPTFVPLMVLALVLTMLYEVTGNLLTSIMAHAVFNGLGFAQLMWLQEQASKYQ
jgi:membrane protease YdiL (CAAX protease family)